MKGIMSKSTRFEKEEKTFIFMDKMHWIRETYVPSHNWQTVCLTDVEIESTLMCVGASRPYLARWQLIHDEYIHLI